MNIGITKMYTVLALMWPALVFSQEIVLSGFIREGGTGESLPFANVVINKNVYVQANQYGYFNTRIPQADSIMIEASFLNYGSTAQSFNLASIPKEIIIYLEPSTLQTIEIVDSRIVRQPGVHTLTQESIKEIPSMMGEPDLIKALSIYPGVSIGAEGTSSLIVRGGSPDQNLILLDGVEVYNVNHLFGFLSTFNTQAINTATLIKSGGPARYGGKLSSVLDIQMKEGNRNEKNTYLNLGILTSSIMHEGPFRNKKGSFLISMRGAHLSILTLPWLLSYKAGTSDFHAAYGMYDMNIKVNYRITDKDQLYISYYNGLDHYSVNQKVNPQNNVNVGIGWGNHTGNIRHHRQLGKNTFWENQLSFSAFRYNISLNYQNKSIGSDQSSSYEFQNTTGIKSLSFKTTLDHGFDSHLRFKAGIEKLGNTFTPDNYRNEYNENGQNKFLDTRHRPYSNTQIIGWAEITWHYAKWLVKGGYRFNYFINDNKIAGGYHDPRLHIQYDASERWSIFAELNKVHQFSHLLTPNATGLPSDVWVPATSMAPPAHSIQSGAGAYYTSTDKKWTYGLELFRRQFRNLITYQSGESIIFNGRYQSWTELIYAGGSGHAKGIEFSAKYESPLFHFQLGYTLSRSERQFEKLNSNEPFPYKYDRTHVIDLFGRYNISKSWELSAYFTFQTGHAITLPTGLYSYQGELYYLYDKINNGRIPDYHRLDLMVTKKYISRKGREKTLTFGLYNSYGRINPTYITSNVTFAYSNNGNPSEVIRINSDLFKRSFLILIPNLSYGIKF